MDSYETLKTKDRRGYIPIVAGFTLIVLGIVILILELQNANLNGYNGSGWLSFYNFWVVVISFCFIAGAFSVVIGLFFLKRVVNISSYALLAAGFALIIFEASRLLIQLGENNTLTRNGIGWYGFQEYWSFGFFSFLTAGIFTIIVGVILGFQAKNKAGYITVSGGLAMILFGLSTLMVNLTTHTSNNLYVNLQYSWSPAIAYSLTVGALICAVGTLYLARARARTRPL